jgi:hypothetical protein
MNTTDEKQETLPRQELVDNVIQVMHRENNTGDISHNLRCAAQRGAIMAVYAERIKTFYAKTGLTPYIGTCSIIVYTEDRAKAAAFRTTFGPPGTVWNREVDSEAGRLMFYIRVPHPLPEYHTELLYLKVDSVALPPSCQLVESEELVPEQVVPAHTKKVFKVVCNDGTPEQEVLL